jgi:sodium pump decarboxylase gamma subunit
VVEGLRLMAVGMSLVFCFLILLVLAMHASARFCSRFAHFFPSDPAPEEQESPAGTPFEKIAVAIAAAKSRAATRKGS